MDPLQQVEQAIAAEVEKMKAAGRSAQEIGAFVQDSMKQFSDAIMKNMQGTVDTITKKYGGGAGGGAPDYNDPAFQKFAREKMSNYMRDPNLQFGADFSKNLDTQRASVEQEWMQQRGGGAGGAMSDGDMAAMQGGGFKSIIDDDSGPMPPQPGAGQPPMGGMHFPKSREIQPPMEGDGAYSPSRSAALDGSGQKGDPGWPDVDEPDPPPYTEGLIPPKGSYKGKPFPSEEELGGGDQYYAHLFRWELDNGAPPWEEGTNDGGEAWNKFKDDYTAKLNGGGGSRYSPTGGGRPQQPMGAPSGGGGMPTDFPYDADESDPNTGPQIIDWLKKSYPGKDPHQLIYHFSGMGRDGNREALQSLMDEHGPPKSGGAGAPARAPKRSMMGAPRY